MPIHLAHGEHDTLMHVGQSRALAARMDHNGDFVYDEIPGRNHDSPLWKIEALGWVLDRV